MTEKRKFEYHLLRCVPNAVRGEGVNIGLVMMEVGGDGGGFAGVHFTKDWRRALCMYPETDVEMLESFGRELTQGLADAQKRALMLREMLENYSNMLQLSEARQWATENPEKDLRQLAAELVEAPRFGLAEVDSLGDGQDVSGGGSLELFAEGIAGRSVHESGGRFHV
jgi:hypothetical protein